MKIAACLFLIIGLAEVFFGQDAVLRGTVETHQGAVIPSAKITATDVKGKEVSAFTDRGGNYELKMGTGTYRILFEREGFKKTLYTAFEFDPVKTARLNVRMEPGECSDCNGEMLGQERWDYYGVLSGTIYDPQGAVIPSAIVTIRGEDGVDRVVKSNGEGIYESRIMRGENRITIQAKNFETVVFEKYRAARSYKGKMFLDLTMIEKNTER